MTCVSSVINFKIFLRKIRVEHLEVDYAKRNSLMRIKAVDSRRRKLGSSGKKWRGQKRNLSQVLTLYLSSSQLTQGNRYQFQSLSRFRPSLSNSSQASPSSLILDLQLQQSSQIPSTWTTCFQIIPCKIQPRKLNKPLRKCFFLTPHLYNRHNSNKRSSNFLIRLQ
jgi:hypothetical protein